MAAIVEFDASSIDALTDKMKEYGAGSGQIIDKVLRSEGAEEIKKEITRLLPASGRNWKGKAPAARSAMPRSFSQTNGELSVTILADGKYSYLYFPDDGSSTKRHAGQQHFMQHGAEAAAPKVLEMCVGKLAEAFNN